MQLCRPQRLVGVDIADSGHDALIQKRAFEPGVPLLDACGDPDYVVLGVEGVPRDVRDDAGQHRAPGIEHQMPERALVDEAQVRAVVVELEPHALVGRRGESGRYDEHLAAHPKMDQQRVLVIEH